MRSRRKTRRLFFPQSASGIANKLLSRIGLIAAAKTRAPCIRARLFSRAEKVGKMMGFSPRVQL
jgi:hypothetical protein